ncbi:MAG: hypothetical protein F4Y24_05275 [Gemmatimonadetes bacterium]|nr:hypothetical protein [Gemmatimonadota bacterium]MYG21934.1 hypothetical protein [Gemmatimonadota bacterium]MYJ39688.1 hypothetical protein [Gemmatimonadota bacterium]
MRRFAIVLSALLVHGCDLFPIVVCTDQLVYGIEVTVRDSTTGELLTSDPTGVLTDGVYRETMEAIGPGSLWGAPERPGTYDIEITAQGYRPWNRQGVEVVMDRDGCHVETVELEARMVALAGHHY